MAQIKTALTKFLIGRIPVQREIVAAPGLGGLNSSIIKEDAPVIRGVVTAVLHLVTIEDVK